MITRPQLLNEIEVIPPFSASLLKLTDIILSGQYTIDDVVHVVRHDQGLTLDVIGLANSAEASAHKGITSIQEAVVRMGGARIMRALLAKWFRGSVAASLGVGKDSVSFWRHGIISAVATDILGSQYPNLSHPAAFATALVHDVGKVPLGRWASSNRIPFSWSLKGLATSYESERQMFGWVHSEVGTMILEKWSFPELMRQAVLHHGEPGGGPEPLTDILRIVNMVCRATDPENDLRDIAGSEVLLRNKIDAEQLGLLASATQEAAVEIIEGFGST